MSRRSSREELMATRVVEGRANELRLQRARLEVRRGAGIAAGTVFVLDRETTTVGSSEGADVRLTDAAVSRHHLEIVACPEGFLVRDLGSTNGTWVDELRVREVFLRPGAVITAGETELVFEPLGDEVQLPLSEEDHYFDLWGRSLAMRRVFATLERVAAKDVTVLVTGESGTGKELVARALHQGSARKKGPLVVIDCSSIPANLMESELFGHERGAFTGADKTNPGAFERAHGGTVFLDEMGELPLDLQPKLLRLLESREVSRLGGGAPKKVDVRVVAATNRDLRRMVNGGGFRSDLFFRLSVVEVRLPALRERPEDVPLLVRRFIDEMSGPTGSRDGPPVLRLSPATLERLKHHPWPGNVRELRNFVARSVALAEGTLVSAAPSLVELPGGVPSSSPAAISAPPSSAPSVPPAGASYEELALQAARQAGHFDLPYKKAKKAFGEPFEKAYLAALLERASGNLSEAARLADVDRTYLHQLLRKFDLR